MGQNNSYIERVENRRSKPNSLIYNEIATLSEEHSAANLSLGYSTIPPPGWLEDILFQELKSVEFTEHAYGSISLRAAIADEIACQTTVRYNPVTDVTVTGSASEAIFAAIISLINSGDNVIIFEPAFSIYAPIVILAGGKPRFIRMNYSRGEFDFDNLKESFDNRTRLLIINNPHSPTGKVFTHIELEFIASLCTYWNTIVLSDEVFDRIILDTAKHVSIASLPSMKDKTIIIGDTGKKFNIRGLKIGYAVATGILTDRFRGIQQLITYRLPTAVEQAFAKIIQVAPETGYYKQLIKDLLFKQVKLKEVLLEFNTPIITTEAGYFILMETNGMAVENSLDFSHRLIQQWGVASLPGQAFYWRNSPYASDGEKFVRFCFAKDDNLLDKSISLLRSASESFTNLNSNS